MRLMHFTGQPGGARVARRDGIVPGERRNAPCRMQPRTAALPAILAAASGRAKIARAAGAALRPGAI